MSEQLEIHGRVAAIKFRDTRKSLWTSILFESPSECEAITAVGELADVNMGDELTLYGTWGNHPKHGRQFQIAYVKQELPTDPIGIMRYLSGGLFKGIGKTLARRIVDRFGRETLKIIAEDPEQLRAVRGISGKKYVRLVDTFEQQRRLHDLAMFLQGHGVSLGLVRKIYDHYDEHAIAVIQENPYRLIRDVPGIGFILADGIARKIGLAPDSPTRIRAAVGYVLDDACTNNGHVFLPEQELTRTAVAFLNRDSEVAHVSADRITEAVNLLIKGGDLYREVGEAIYSRLNYFSEVKLAKLVCDLAQTQLDVKCDLEEKIAETQRLLDKNYADEQKEAIRTALQSPIAVLTGGPGTGKSTVVHGIIKTLLQVNPHAKVLLAAPTGKAAKRLSDVTGVEARTVHRLLEFAASEGGFQRNAESPLKADLIVVDEVSMIDLYLAVSLVQAIEKGTQVLFVGDPDQLPPVGLGNFLNDLIRSGVVPVVKLNRIFRQENAAESRIVLTAHAINNGDMPDLSTAPDFYFKELNDNDAIADYVEEAVRTRLEKGYTPEQLNVLTPMRKGTTGVTELNKRLQQIINPAAAGKAEITLNFETFRDGDRVMQTSNNYRLDVYNGDVGRIVAINKAPEQDPDRDDDAEREEDEIVVEFEDGRLVPFPLSAASGLTLAYCMTIHKSQGSEYNGVCIVIVSLSHHNMLQRNLLYTAITRAKDKCLLVGQRNAVRRCVTNKGTQVRYTKLTERLQQIG